MVAISDAFNALSAASILFVMLITVLDVILRRLFTPLPGAYDVVSVVSSFIISFSLGYTSLQKGHIAVDFVFQKLPEKAARFLAAANELIASIFFAVLSWQSFCFAKRSLAAGEVSPTVQLPFYPFILGVSLGALLLSLILFLNFAREMEKALRK
ncbi:MAG: TRAP transporter small permease [Spirochaetes bacterium]|nr:TRAP transporter small permease [Spirochaetota bacterium]